LFAIIAVSAKWPSFRITTWRGFRAAPFLFSKLNFNVRFGSKADICSAKGHVRFAPNSDRESGDLYTVLAGSELGFDESGEGENLRRRPLHPDLFQNRLELLAKPIKGRS
jgi:hypothetical protein